MDEEQALFAEVLAAPDDDAPRLVYADWLAERGDPRGEFIQLQCEIENTDVNARRQEYKRRAAAILRKHRGQWLEPLAKLIRKPEFVRGFVEIGVTGLSLFLQKGGTLLERTPLRQITLTTGANKAAEFTQCATVEKLSGLGLDRNPFPDEQLATVLASPHLKNLTHLRIHNRRFRGRAAAALAQSPHLAKLVELEIVADRDTDPIANQLAGSPHLRNLEHLSLRTTPLGAGGVQTIVQSPIVAKVKTLNLSYCDVRNEGLIAITQSPHLTNVEILDLSYPHWSWGRMITDEGAQALAAWPGLAKLQRLYLTHQQLAIRGVRALVESPHWNGTNLYLRRNDLSEREIAALQREFGKRFGNFG